MIDSVAQIDSAIEQRHPQMDSSLRKTERLMPSGSPEVTYCHLIITRCKDSQILLFPDGNSYLLPQVMIPRRQRPAPHLLRLVRNLWGIDAICRFSLSTEEAGSDPQYFVLEALKSDGLIDHAVWIPTDEFDNKSIEPTADRGVRAALGRAKAYDNGEIPGNFVRSGWLEEVTEWVRSELDTHQLTLNGCVEQFNMGPDFSLIRYGTSGRTIWFKAVGEANRREYTITNSLGALESAHLPSFLPRIRGGMAG